MIDREEMREIVFEAWKAEAQHHANHLQVVAGDDLWDHGDSYDVAEAAVAAFAAHEDPVRFVERVFDEDLASRAHDEEMEREALEDGDDDVGDDVDELEFE